MLVATQGREWMSRFRRDEPTFPSLAPLTCAFAAGVLSLGRAEEPAVKVFLPELCEPHVSAVVLQRESGEVFVESWWRCEGGEYSKIREETFAQSDAADLGEDLAVNFRKQTMLGILFHHNVTTVSLPLKPCGSLVISLIQEITLILKTGYIINNWGNGLVPQPVATACSVL